MPIISPVKQQELAISIHASHSLLNLPSSCLPIPPARSSQSTKKLLFLYESGKLVSLRTGATGTFGGKDHQGFCLRTILMSLQPGVCGASMKLKKQVTVCGRNAIFCVAVFSLYLMLDRVQHDPARHQNGGNFPQVSQSWLLTSV